MTYLPFWNMPLAIAKIDNCRTYDQLIKSQRFCCGAFSVSLRSFFYTFPGDLAMIFRRMGCDARTGAPKAARVALHLNDGDEIVYTIDAHDRAVISKALSPDVIDNPFAAFCEWHSDADRKAYARL